MDYLTGIRAFHQENVEPHIGKPKGCSEAEVRKLEKRVGFDFPLAYKQYLLWMGKDYDGIFRGTDCFINDALENTEWLPQLLRENDIEPNLPQHYLVFSSHQGYIVHWFELPKISDDPPIYSFAEGQTPEPRPDGLFTEWLMGSIRDLAPYTARRALYPAPIKVQPNPYKDGVYTKGFYLGGLILRIYRLLEKAIRQLWS